MIRICHYVLILLGQIAVEQFQWSQLSYFAAFFDWFFLEAVYFDFAGLKFNQILFVDASQNNCKLILNLLLELCLFRHLHDAFQAMFHIDRDLTFVFLFFVDEVCNVTMDADHVLFHLFSLGITLSFQPPNFILVPFPNLFYQISQFRYLNFFKLLNLSLQQICNSPIE